jgi:hypothetical protein
MSRRTFKCNNIQQKVMSQTQNLKNPIKPNKPPLQKKTIKPNKTQKNPPGWVFKKKTRVLPTLAPKMV